MPASPAAAPAPARRTQQQRRAATRGVLLGAAVEQLVEAGMAGFTTTEVCRRAGVSQGALFKHFESKARLLAAVTEFIFDELRAEYEQAYAALGPDDRTSQAVVELLWDQMIDPRLAAAYELYTAARTDAPLAAALEPVVGSHVERIHEMARYLRPDVDDETRLMAVDLALLSIQGLILNQMARPDEAQRQRLRVVLDRLVPILLEDSHG